MVYEALGAARNLANENISVEVIDPRTLIPLDRETIIESVRKTGRWWLPMKPAKPAALLRKLLHRVTSDREAFDKLKAHLPGFADWISRFLLALRWKNSPSPTRPSSSKPSKT